MGTSRPTPLWKRLFVEDGTYKLVSLGVAVVLWLTILGRRDFVMTKEIDLEFLLPAGLVLSSVPEQKTAVVEVSGPRWALRRFLQSPPAVTLDLRDKPSGSSRVEIRLRSIEVPFGVKLMSVNPQWIMVRLEAKRP